jgi:hypothetical protein
MTFVLAHHNLVEAIPFFMPMLVVVIGLAVVMIRDRRKGGGDTTSS